MREISADLGADNIFQYNIYVYLVFTCIYLRRRHGRPEPQVVVLVISLFVVVGVELCVSVGVETIYKETFVRNLVNQILQIAFFAPNSLFTRKLL